MIVPRLGVGAYAIVLEGIDRKSGGYVAIKFIQLYRGAMQTSEIETRERFFDQEIGKIKALANDPFLLEYVDDALLRHDQLVLLRPAPGANAYQISFLDPHVAGPDVVAALAGMNQHLGQAPVAGEDDPAWSNELYVLRSALRQAVARSNNPQLLSAQLLNGQHFLITKKYQTTLTRLLIQQQNLPLEEKLALLLELIKALKQIHTIGITHGDLCPDNIMFKLSLQGDRALINQLREEAIPTRYLYELQSVLIDLGRVVKADFEKRDRVTVGLPIGEGNNRLPYAPMEMVLMSERLPFERYVVAREDGNLLLRPMWEFEVLSSADELLGELTLPSEGRGATAQEGMSRGRRLGHLFTKGDILYNSTWGFVVEETREDHVLLRGDDIYRYDHQNRMLVRVPPEVFLESGIDGRRWEFDDVLHANYQHGIPADIFAMGMTIIDTIVGNSLPPGALREFADRCRTIVAGKRTPKELAADPDLRLVAAEFGKLGLTDLFSIVLCCVVRADPSLGYYCRNHADDNRLATIRLLRDFTEFSQQFHAVHSDTHVEARIRELSEQLERYKQVLGTDVDRTAMYQDMAAAKTRLDELQRKCQRQSEEISVLQNSLAAARADLEESEQRRDALGEEKAATERALAEARSRIAELQARLEAASREAQTQATRIVELENDVARARDAEAQAREALNAALQEVENLKDQIRALEEQTLALERNIASTKAARAEDEQRLVALREKLAAFTSKYGPDYRRSVKGWFSRKPAAQLLADFSGILAVGGEAHHAATTGKEQS